MTDFDNSQTAPECQQRGLMTEAELDALVAIIEGSKIDMLQRAHRALTALRAERDDWKPRAEAAEARVARVAELEKVMPPAGDRSEVDRVAKWLRSRLPGNTAMLHEAADLLVQTADERIDALTYIAAIKTAPECHQPDLVTADGGQAAQPVETPPGLEPVAWRHGYTVPTDDGTRIQQWGFSVKKMWSDDQPLYTAPRPLTVQDAARMLLADPDAVAKLAQAYDREDSAQRGEADPHDGRLFPTDPEWDGERIACATAALRAIAEGRA